MQLTRCGRPLLAVLLLASAFVLVHGYSGVRHDGILYAGEALARIVPGQLHDDLYFLFGSQGRFTVLPTLYGWLIATFGFGNGSFVGLIFASTLFLVGTCLLVKTFAPEPLPFYCALSVVLGWSVYGGRRVFAYSEPFLTARSFAEPAVLIALTLLMRRHTWAALLMFAVGAIFHPLICAGGLAVGWLMMVADDRRWLVLALLASIISLISCVSGFGPFTDIAQHYDPQWLALVQEVNPHAFILNWSLEDAGVIVFDVVCLMLALGAKVGRQLRILIVAALVIGLASVLSSFIFVDLVGSVIVGKLQVWRALWIMHWLAMATFPIALVRLWSDSSAGRVAACALAIGWMAPYSPAPALVAMLAVAVFGLRSRFNASLTLVRLMVGSVIVCGSLIAIQSELRVVKLGGILDQPVRIIIAQFLAVNLIVLVLVVALWHKRETGGRSLIAVAIAVFLTSASVWDQRAAWTKRMESYGITHHIWSEVIEPQAKVYWYRDLMAPWLLLGHGNYYTAQQGSGAVFSRDMVLELDKRKKVTGILDFQEQICRLMNGLNETQASCEPSLDTVEEVCKASQIDYMVLQSTLEGAAPIAEFSTGVVENGYEKKFFLFRCAALKSG